MASSSPWETTTSSVRVNALLVADRLIYSG